MDGKSGIDNFCQYLIIQLIMAFHLTRDDFTDNIP